jgi:uncharacterized membrane protein
MNIVDFLIIQFNIPNLIYHYCWLTLHCTLYPIIIPVKSPSYSMISPMLLVIYPINSLKHTYCISIVPSIIPQIKNNNTNNINTAQNNLVIILVIILLIVLILIIILIRTIIKNDATTKNSNTHNNNNTSNNTTNDNTKNNNNSKKD